MEYTVGSLIEALSHFDKDLKIENPIILTWHHESETNQTYDSMDDLDDDCFETLGEKIKGMEVSTIYDGTSVVETLAERIAGRGATISEKGSL